MVFLHLQLFLSSFSFHLGITIRGWGALAFKVSERAAAQLIKLHSRDTKIERVSCIGTVAIFFCNFFYSLVGLVSKVGQKVGLFEPVVSNMFLNSNIFNTTSGKTAAPSIAWAAFCQRILWMNDRRAWIYYSLHDQSTLVWAVAFRGQNVFMVFWQQATFQNPY
jgi:hypothetical protein